MKISQQRREALGLTINKMRTIKQKFYTKDGGMFITSDEARADIAIKPAHGKQNKHHGRQAGSYKHKRDIVRKARKRNRQVSRK